MRRKALDLSTTQLIASGLATLAAAVGASFLGVYGTVIGAAFMSVVSTAGAAVGKHYLDQGKEQIKERTHLQDAVRDETVARGAAAEALNADPTRTVVWPGGSGRPGGDPNATLLDPPGGGDPNATRLDLSPAETVADALAAEAGGEAVRRAAWRDAFRDSLAWARRRWAVLAVSSVAVFAVVMAGITVLEKITDKPAASWVGADDGRGTTWSNLGNDDGGGAEPAETPSPGTTRESERPTDTPATGGQETAPETGRPTPPATSGPEQPDRPTPTPSTEPEQPVDPGTTTAPTAPGGGGGDQQQDGSGAGTQRENQGS
ncbi:hypothetical protein [Spirillospora sp. NPDC029432]|uniref:hypothetical protein n=1 Tax=Spirillospora sp. NPDC029432 TaxID=3154599 RepID=UPI0034532F86